MKRQFSSFLKDIILEIEIINRATKNLTFEDFKNDEIVIRAVTRSFEIIGEAVSYLPPEIKQKYKEIPWRDIKDFRNVIIHKYWGLELEKEWSIIENELKDLEIKIKKILKLENIN
ncbi:MAG: DUF86 domain-containing protein [Nanoarchaeota archaeon]|nr:DUF86 domain-containing protein [Nanoarchaeota archaeon]